MNAGDKLVRRELVVRRVAASSHKSRGAMDVKFKGGNGGKWGAF